MADVFGWGPEFVTYAEKKNIAAALNPERKCSVISPEEDAQRKVFQEFIGKEMLPLSEDDIETVKKALGPLMHRRWARDRKAEGNCEWLRSHGFLTKEEFNAWKDNNPDIAVQSIRQPIETGVANTNDIFTQEWKNQLIDLLVFYQEDDTTGINAFIKLPPKWQKNNIDAATQNTRIVSRQLEVKKGSLAPNDLDSMGAQVHEDWILSNFTNRVTQEILSGSDESLLRTAKEKVVAYGKLFWSNDADPQPLAILKKEALEAVYAYAKTIKVTPGNVEKKTIAEAKDQLSSWEQLSSSEKAKDMAMINATLAEIHKVKNAFATPVSRA